MPIPKFDREYLPQGYIRIEDGVFTGMLFRPEYFALTAEEKAQICNGIGADSGITKHFPDTIYGLDCRECGNCHDFDYWRGGNEEDRATADRVFLHNLYVTIDKGSWWLRYLRKSRARTYYVALTLAGRSHFNYHAI